MTIGWAIIIVAVLYLLEKYGLLKKALIVSGITLGVAVVGYVGFLGIVLIKDKWDAHHVSGQAKPKPGQCTPEDANGFSICDTISPHPDGSGIAPTVQVQGLPPGITFDSSPTKTDLIQRRGSQVFVKAICYNEDSRRATDSPFNKDGQWACKPPLVLMEEVK